jgi:hypothetical protein
VHFTHWMFDLADLSLLQLTHTSSGLIETLNNLLVVIFCVLVRKKTVHLTEF